MLTVYHPWHGAHYGDNAPLAVNAVIEISQGSRAKYEVDKPTGLLKLDRVIYSLFIIPSTMALFHKHSDRMEIRLIFSYSVHKQYNHFVLLKQM